MEKNILSVRKRRTHNFGIQKKWMRAECVIAACVLLNRLLFYMFVGIPKLDGDTQTYLGLTLGRFLRGERMPLYPLVIQLNRLLFHDGYLVGVVVFQIIISLIAVLYLYRAVRMATGNRGIACVTAFFYGGNQWIMYSDVTILTESFAVSVSVFLLYHTVCYIRSHSLRNGMAMVLCVLLAAFLKSAMFVYVIAYLIFMAIQFFCVKDRRKTILKLSAALLGIAFLLLIYAGQVWQNAGTFSVDKRGPRHMLIACLETGLYKNYPDRGLVEKIEKIYLEGGKTYGWDSTLKPIFMLFGDNVKDYNIGLRKFNNYCIRSNFGVYVRYLLRRFVKATWRIYEQVDETEETSLIFQRVYRIQLLLFPPIKIGHVYVICGAILLLLIVKWRRNKECPWYYLGTAGMILVILVSVIVGTYCCYARCTSYVLPFAFFGLALLLRDFLVWATRCGRISDDESKSEFKR